MIPPAAPFRLLPRPFLVLALFPLLLPRASAAGGRSGDTGTLHGRVVSEFGQPLAFANVVVLETRSGAMTDVTGSYLVREVPAGDRAVRVSFLGYVSLEQAVHLDPGDTLEINFMLVEAARTTLIPRSSQVAGLNLTRIPSWFIDGNTGFALAVNRERAASGENVLTSPFGIASWLGMMCAGARGTAAEELAALLGFAGDASEVHGSFRAMNEYLLSISRAKDLEILVANGLWKAEGASISREFLDTAGNDYAAEVRTADFVREGDKTARKITRWFSLKTRGRIPAVVEPVDPRAVLVAANAVCLDARWATPFAPERTHSEPFRVTSRDTVHVPMMHGDLSLPYFEEEGIQFLRLPYYRALLFFEIVLPRDPDGLNEVETSLDPGRLNRWRKASRLRAVEVSLPRFDIDQSLDLEPLLKAMGTASAFAPSADFSGICGASAGRVSLSMTALRARITVDERGVKTSSATVVKAVRDMVGRREGSVVFRADHPFLFLVVEARTGTVLFLGRMESPGKRAG